jgi:phenylpropionate dioxygenase-like ring-hydroxylating dioxygenase large terminal subunit
MTESRQARYSEAGIVPKERYISREWLAAEYERLWPAVWQMACRVEEIPRVGDFVEYGIGSQSVLIVRESAVSIRAFRNTCLHRGTRLCAGAGNAGDELLCRFHGWAWNLDGSIREVPDASDFAAECVGRSDLQLPEVHLGTWGGFVFINMAADPEPLMEFLAPVAEGLAPFEVDKMRLLRYRTTVMDCNWKVGLDAFNEAYHIEATHSWDLSGMREAEGGTRLNSRYASRRGRTAGPTVGNYGFSYETYENHNMMRSVPDSGRTSPKLGDLGGDARDLALTILQNQEQISLAHQDDIDYVRSLPEVPRDATALSFLNDVRRQVGKAGGVDYSHISDEDLLANIDYCIYPNMVGPISAGNWILFRFRPNGDDPDTCIFDVFFLHRFPDGQEPSKVEHEWYPHWTDHDNWRFTLLQDLSNMAHVQRGMHQRTFPGLRLNRQEAGIRNHHRFLYRYMK